MLSASISTPIGKLNIEATDGAIIALYFTSKPHEVQSGHPLILEAKLQLQSYFDGSCKEFKLPLNPSGTAFQSQVWEGLNKIPYGQTTTYQKLAMVMGDENKVRAVASANAANPIAIVIPCHRVIAGNGQLTGYAWGLDRKEWLLQHEQHREQLKLF